MTLATLGRSKSGELMFQNPRWTPIDTIRVDVFIEGEWHEYHCTDYDDAAHGQELWKQLTTTYVNEVAACTDEEKYEWAESDIKSMRNVALRETDWLACVDVELENHDEWLEYRQALRDITSQPGYPFDVIIPEKPRRTRNIFNLAERKERKRARNADGTFKADDPSTPDINEAWEYIN
jgi:hypothetical protein